MIELNHTIVPVSNRHRGAEFFTHLVGVESGKANGPFVGVRVNDHLTLAFDDRRGASPGHYAFLVDDEIFDHVLDSAAKLGVACGSGPAGGWDHDHFEVCNRTIAVGDTSWLTARGSPYHLCRYCYGRVVRLRRADNSRPLGERRPTRRV